MAIARLGWAAAGIVVAGLFLSRKRRRYWLLLPIVAALPTLLMGHDLQAALAAFLAVGITVLGFLIYGRHWWGPLLVIGSVVMLTLLLAPDAYIVIGLAFTVILLAALGLIISSRRQMAPAPVLPATQAVSVCESASHRTTRRSSDATGCTPGDKERAQANEREQDDG